MSLEALERAYREDPNECLEREVNKARLRVGLAPMKGRPVRLARTWRSQRRRKIHAVGETLHIRQPWYIERAFGERAPAIPCGARWSEPSAVRVNPANIVTCGDCRKALGPWVFDYDRIRGRDGASVINSDVFGIRDMSFVCAGRQDLPWATAQLRTALAIIDSLTMRLAESEDRRRRLERG